MIKGVVEAQSNPSNSPVFIENSQPKIPREGGVDTMVDAVVDSGEALGEEISGYETHFAQMLGVLVSGCTNDAFAETTNSGRMQQFVDHWDNLYPHEQWEDDSQTRAYVHRAKQHLLHRLDPTPGPDAAENRRAYYAIIKVVGTEVVMSDTEEEIVQKLVRAKGLGSTLRYSAEAAAQEMKQNMLPKHGESVVWVRETGFTLDSNKLHMVQALAQDSEVRKLIESKGYSDIATYAKSVIEGKVTDQTHSSELTDEDLLLALDEAKRPKNKSVAYMQVLRLISDSAPPGENVNTDLLITRYLSQPNQFWKDFNPPEPASSSDESQEVSRLTPSVKLTLLTTLLPTYYTYVFGSRAKIPDTTMLVTARTDFMRFSAENTAEPEVLQSLTALQKALRHNLHGITLGPLQGSEELSAHLDQIREAVSLIAEGKIHVQVGEIKLDVGSKRIEHRQIGSTYKKDIAHSVVAILQTVASLDRGLAEPIPLCLCARILLDEDPLRAIRRTLTLAGGGAEGKIRASDILGGTKEERIEHRKQNETQDGVSPSIFQENMLRLFAILEDNISVSVAHYQWDLFEDTNEDGTQTISPDKASVPPRPTIFTYPPKDIKKAMGTLTRKLIQTWLADRPKA